MRSLWTAALLGTLVGLLGASGRVVLRERAEAPVSVSGRRPPARPAPLVDSAAPAAGTPAAPADTVVVPAPGSLAAPAAPPTVPDTSASAVPDRRLARIYGSMAPRQAAEILARMKDPEAGEILSQLRERRVAEILGYLPPERAVALSRLVARPVATGTGSGSP